MPVPLFGWAYQRVQADKRRLLDEDAGMVWPFVRSMLIGAGGGVALFLCAHAMDGPELTPATAFLAVCVLLAAFGSWRRANAYRQGWVDGRKDAVAQMPLMLNRQMSPQQWYRAQLARDLTAEGMQTEDIFTHMDRLMEVVEVARRRLEEDDGNGR